MHLGISITPFGHHPAAWLKYGSPNALQFGGLSEQVRQAQEAKLDFVFFSDSLGRRPVEDLSPQAVPFEPTTLVAALATGAREIGLIATAAMEQHEPYNLARRFASLDTISHGRTGWSYVASSSHAKSAEYIEVVSGLWDSWQDDAFIYDKAKGRFFQPEKMHVLNHKGENFAVRGPLNVNRSPQGKPVVATVLSAQTLELAAQTADLIFLDALSPDKLKQTLSSLQQAFNRHQRDKGSAKVLANIIPYAGATNVEANRQRQELNDLAKGNWKPVGVELVGTPEIIADQLQELDELVDGFTMLPPTASESDNAIFGGVIPELQKRGLLRSAYSGHTLREHLNLPRPAHPAIAGQST